MAPTWAEEDIQEDSNHYQALSSEDLDEERVYLVRCLDTGTLQALELYNDSEEGVDIHCAKTSESFIANTQAPKKEPIKAAIGKQMNHTNLQKLAEEASKGKPELSFKDKYQRNTGVIRRFSKDKNKANYHPAALGITK